MIIARFQFKPGAANQFCWLASQEIVEMTFNTTAELVELCKEIEDSLVDCTALVNDKILVLSGFAS